MKSSLLLIISIFVSLFVAGQLTEPTVTLKPTPVSAQKTAQFIEKFNYLKKDVDRLYDSVTVLKKEMSILSTQLKKKSNLKGLSADENMRIQLLMREFSQSQTLISGIIKKVRDSTNSLLIR